MQRPPWPDSPLTATLGEEDWIWDRQIETASAEHVLAACDQSWNDQTARLLARSAFYRAKFEEAGVRLGSVKSVLDLPFLPTTTKEETRLSQDQHPPYGDYLGVDPAEVKRVFSTSGSSGRPNLIALTVPDLETWNQLGARSYYATGVRSHHSVLTTFGAGPFVAGNTHNVLDVIGCRRVPVGPGDTERVMNALRSGLVDTLLGTASFPLHLVSVLAERGIDGPGLGLRHVVTGGEPGGGIPAVRRRIEEGFGCTVTEIAGIGDLAPSLFGECPMQGGLHFCGQGLIWPELIDLTTDQAVAFEPGRRGELLFTALRREAMPLVRFRSRDIAEVQDGPCECGRTSFRIRIVGRVDDMFIVRGVNVYPSAVQAVVAEFQPAVTGRARIVLPIGGGVGVEPPVPVEVEVPTDRAVPDGLSDRIAEAIRAGLLFRASVTLVPHRQFGEAGYKTKLLVRR